MRQFEGYGPPELATGGKDGCMRVWDIRQPATSVAAFQPAASDQVRRHAMSVQSILSLHACTPRFKASKQLRACPKGLCHDGWSQMRTGEVSRCSCLVYCVP